MKLNEKLFPLAKAYELAFGVRPNPSTCQRHRLHGINGVKLETAKYGGRRMTSVEAVQRFITSVTAAADGPVCPPRTNRQREAAISKAERDCERDGL
ncbi:DUF1580 domain-containing protein [Bythopirellula polymerisocia]|uniref:DUF1580 domain-containing protein n=1 Tax=Bythopirellula polymerisocia TaxID=2528003 RepID=A0A5C6D481_9BACT|nr:DUF1580 domain-containing protein [Bythopirellula polymerisocia]TWU29649.1 hypothetical protein Pla144_04280 [Bythopirellula polymerisocia]